MRTSFVFLLAAALLCGCLPSVYSIEGVRTQSLVFTLDDSTTYRGDVHSLTERSVVLGNWSTAGRAGDGVNSPIELPRVRIAKAVDSNGRDVTEHYILPTPTERYLGRLADAHSRIYNLTLISVATSILSIIAVLTATK